MSIDATVDRPVSTIDPFSHGFLRDPYPHHEVLREAGPVVWLEQYGIWAMARHQEVRDALTDWQTYCSSAGVGLSDFRKENRHGVRRALFLKPTRRCTRAPARC